MQADDLKLSRVEDYCLTFLEDLPYVYHCHHYNLFHDQTVDDALGEEAGRELRMVASREATYPLIQRCCATAGALTPAERLETAAALFRWMGHGDLEFAVQAHGGEVRGEHLHYGLSWREKYGSGVRRTTPADAFGAGFAAAATEVAFNLPTGELAVEETHCVALREPECDIHLAPGGKRDLGRIRSERAEILPRLGATFGGLDEERIAAIGSGLADFVRGAASDERGLIRAFNVYVTRHLAAYYNTSIYRAVRQVEARMPQSSAAAEWLFREAGHVCVFNTFGNVLLSPEWEGLIGPLSGLPEDTLSYCCAIARGLGFGRWTLAEHVPGKRLVLRTPATYESIFDLCNHGASTRGRCYILQGAAVALMVLAQRVPWTESPSLTPEFYASLFSAGPLPWKVEETRCIAKGDSYCEAVVTEV